MNSKIKGLFVLFVLLVSVSVFSQDYSEIKQFNKTLKTKLLITTVLQKATLFDRMYYSSSKSDSDILTPALEEFIESDEWVNIVREDLSQFLMAHGQDLKESNPEFWKNMARGTGKFILNIYKSFKVNSLMSGIDSGIVFLVGKGIEYSLPYLFYLSGNPALGSAFFFVPTGTALFGAYGLMKKMFRNIKIKRMYGENLEVYETIKNLEAAVEKVLNLEKDGTLLFPFTALDGKTKLLSINNKFALSKSFVTFKQIKSFLTFNAQADLLKMVRMRGFTTVSKVSILVSEIYKRQNADLIKKFEEKFYYAISSPILNRDKTEVFQWATEIEKVKSCVEFSDFIQNAPKNSLTRDVNKLIQEVFVSFLAENWKGWKVGTFRRLRRELQKIDVEINLSEEIHFNSEWRVKYSDLFSRVCR